MLHPPVPPPQLHSTTPATRVRPLRIIVEQFQPESYRLHSNGIVEVLCRHCTARIKGRKLRRLISSNTRSDVTLARTCNPRVREEMARPQVRGGPLDLRIGAISKRNECETCHQNMQDFSGHFAFTRPRLPVFHTGFFKSTVQFPQMICKYSNHVLLDIRTPSQIFNDSNGVARFVG